MNKKITAKVNVKRIFLVLLGLVLLVGVGIFGALKYYEKNKSLKVLKAKYHVSKMSDYYQEYANKCLKTHNPSCCLDSVSNAEIEDSLVFENYNSNMNIEAKCPDGYQPSANFCETSYAWCEKIKK